MTAVLFYVCEPTSQYKVTNKKDGKIYKMVKKKKEKKAYLPPQALKLFLHTSARSLLKRNIVEIQYTAMDVSKPAI